MPTPETAQKKMIKDYLLLKGYFVFHHLAGLGVFPGMPDMQAIKDGKVYMIEVKAHNGRQSEKQKLFQFHWESCGGKYILGGIDEVMAVMR